MRADAQTLENSRLEGLSLENYPWFHERHRIFPEIFRGRSHGRILDLAAGVGVVAKRIKDGYSGTIVANDISDEALKSLKANRIDALSFDLDSKEASFPFADETYDAVISLATIEHIIHLDYHVQEIRRILKTGGYLYISAPNYSGFQFFFPYLLRGRSFHNPLGNDLEKYEFHAHVRYFTYKTLLDFISSFGFSPVEVYLPLPKDSSRYNRLKNRSAMAAFAFRMSVWLLYRLLSPRWAFHPVLCFVKSGKKDRPGKPRKVIL
jgi:SAM-dependent methyltransferase